VPLTYLLATAVLAAGTVLAAARFPGGFDWAYTVMSALASAKHNPAGGAWFAGALALALGLLWPAAQRIRHEVRARGFTPGYGHLALRIGLAGGIAVGLERLFIFHASSHLPKAHEALAVITFLSLYGGLFALYRERLRLSPQAFWPALALGLPLIAIGVSLTFLYFDQRDLGWVDRRWRDFGIPVTLSFAFWQWIGAATLWASLGYLALTPPAAAPRIPAL
jgi:hypothetical protein